MTDYAFTQKSGFLVDEEKYRRHKSYDYEAECLPVVRVRLRREGGFLSRKTQVLADTGATVSTLTGSAAERLGINCWPKENELLKVCRGPGGLPLVGLSRHAFVQLAGKTQLIEVLVPSKVDTDPQGRIVLGAKPTSNLLGRNGILGNYLLCFDSKRLYAFARW